MGQALLTRIALVGALLLLAMPAPAQPLAKVNAAEPKAALLYTPTSPTEGRWVDVPVTLDTAGLHVGSHLVPPAAIVEAIYERRRGGFRGIARPRRVRYVLTLHYTTGDGRAYLLVELGKDIADRLVNELQVRGVRLQTRDTQG